MALPHLEARWAVIRELQDLRSRTSSILQHQDYDKAIDLALQPRRKIDTPFLRRNLLRDARRSRQNASKNREVPFDEICEESFELGSDIGRADEVFFANDLLNQIASTASEVKYGTRCFSSLLNGDSIIETARSVGRTPRRIGYAFRRLRRMSRSIIDIQS